MIGVVRFIRSLFSPGKAAWAPARPLPSWPETVETMYSRLPSVSSDAEIIKVVYSADREKRCMITRNRKHGIHQFRMEQLIPWSDEEWLYISRDPDALPAKWTALGNFGRSFFGTEREAWNELVNTRDYKLYFDR